MSALLETRGGESIVKIGSEENVIASDGVEVPLPRCSTSGVITEPKSYSTPCENNNIGEAHVDYVIERPASVQSNNVSIQEGGMPLTMLNSDSESLCRTVQKFAVNVERLRVTYGQGSDTLEVLKGIDLVLPEGKIYGLLGPSGCGKTTLLKCIVGMKRPQEGLVRVFDQVPGTPGALIPGPGVGFMPQKHSLYPEASIHETLYFFGKIFRMPKSMLQERIRFLLKFLNLPDGRRLLKKLSGGERRRVSLAAAIIHKPALLILDEPTANVDPLLAKKIWEYLVTLTREEGMTVIVTTHHVEEARQANIVGIMRSGRMLAQDLPDRLLEDFRCKTLNDVFKELCRADNEGRAIVKHTDTFEVAGEEAEHDNCSVAGREKEDVPIYEIPSEVKHTLPPGTSNFDKYFNNTFWDALCRTFALIVNNLTLMRRNRAMLMFSFSVPSIQMVLFCLCIGAEMYELTMAVVNSDVHPVLSQSFLDSISNHTIIQRPYADFNQALTSAERGETWGVISIGHDFSSAVRYRFFLGAEADNETIQESIVDLYMDMASPQIRLTLQKTLFESYLKFCESMLGGMNKNEALAQLPVQINDPVYGTSQPNFTNFMAPGIILSITFFMSVGLTAISIIKENREGTMDRCRVAGVQPLEVVLSHVVSQFCVLCVQDTFLLLVTFVFFEMPLKGSLTLVILLTLLQGVTGMIYGLLISSRCASEESAIILTIGTFLSNLLLSGIIWSSESMPKILRSFAYFLPQTCAVDGLRSIMYRGWGIEKYEVWIGFLISIVWSVFFLLLATAAFKARN